MYPDTTCEYSRTSPARTSLRWIVASIDLSYVCISGFVARPYVCMAFRPAIALPSLRMTTEQNTSVW